MSIRNRVTAGIVAVIFSVSTVLGMIVYSSEIFESSRVTYVVFFAAFAVVSYVFMAILYHLRNKYSFNDKEDVATFFAKKHISIKLDFLFCFGVFLVFSVFSVLAFYPGIFGYDGPVQAAMLYLETVRLTAHHPLAHTYLIGGCFQLGTLIFGNYNAGLVIYSILQSVVMDLIFAYLVCWMRKHRIHRAFRIFGIVFLVVNPIIQILNVNTTKDILFSGFLLLMFLRLIDLYTEPESFRFKRENTSNILSIIGTATVMCVLRNQGYYLLALVFVFTLICYWRKQVHIPILLGICTFVGWFLMGPMISILGIKKGDSREMLSLPMQQMAAVWVANQSQEIAVDEEDIQMIESLVSKEYLEKYMPSNADYVKSGFNTDELKAHMLDYISLYMRLGMKYKLIYIEEFENLTGRYLYIDDYGTARSLMHVNTSPAFVGFNICGTYRESKLPGYEVYLTQFSDNLQDIPILRIIFGNAFPIWLVIILFFVSFFEGNKKLWLSLLLMVGQLGILLLSPACLVRYVYPLMICVPLLLALIMQKEEVEQEQVGEEN